MKELRYLILFLTTVWIFYLIFGYGLQHIEFEAPVYKRDYGPFNTPIAFYCAPSGVEYIVTPNAITLHVDPVGFPVNCLRA